MGTNVAKVVTENGVTYELLPGQWKKESDGIVTIPLRIFGIDTKFHINTKKEFDWIYIFISFFTYTGKKELFDPQASKDWFAEHDGKIGLDYILHYTDLYEVISEARKKCPFLTGMPNIKLWLKKAETLKTTIQSYLDQKTLNGIVLELKENIEKYLFNPSSSTGLQRALHLYHTVVEQDKEKHLVPHDPLEDALFLLDKNRYLFEQDIIDKGISFNMKAPRVINTQRHVCVPLRIDGREFDLVIRPVNDSLERAILIRDEIMFRFFMEINEEEHCLGIRADQYSFLVRTQEAWKRGIEHMHLFAYSNIRDICLQLSEDESNSFWRLIVDNKSPAVCLREIMRRSLGDHEHEKYADELERQICVITSHEEHDKIELLYLETEREATKKDAF